MSTQNTYMIEAGLNGEWITHSIGEPTPRTKRQAVTTLLSALYEYGRDTECRVTLLDGETGRFKDVTEDIAELAVMQVTEGGRTHAAGWLQNYGRYSAGAAYDSHLDLLNEQAERRAVA